MPGPTDFNLSPIATLAHTGDTLPAPMHKAFWARWRESVEGASPRLTAADPADAAAAGDPGVTHLFDSVGSVRIGCRLELPPRSTPLTGALVASHGYGSPEPLESAAARYRAITSRGLAVLLIRIRAYPGSQLDTGDWTAGATSPTNTPDNPAWITRGFTTEPNRPEDLLDWSLPQGVADIACALTALHAWIATRAANHASTPLFLHGESFGAGLAVIAAAQLTESHSPAAPARLVLGVPTFGDWAWRLADPARMALGSGAELLTHLRALGATDESILDTLRLCDAAVHARTLTCPTLCKLAQRDEVVPAPAAAAIYNALGVDPGRKWRFIVSEGHTEPSIACARRLALFEKCAADFLDPSRDPSDAMVPWDDLLESGDRAPQAQSEPLTGEQSGLFADEPTRDQTDDLLISAYQRAGRTLDDLPYTQEWATFFAEIGPPTNLREREAFHRLHNLRKAGKLPRMGKATSTPPRITPDEERDLAQRVESIVGSLGQRDRLPFTPDFDRLTDAFNATTGRDLTPHDTWRLIAKLAK